MRSIANFISYLLNPLLIPLLGVLLILHAPNFQFFSFKQQLYISSILVLFSIGMPASILPVLKYFKLIETVELEKRNERFVPLLVATISFYITHYLLTQIGSPKLISIFTFGVAITALFILFITIFWKISIHVSAMGGLTALVIVLMQVHPSTFTIFLPVAIIASGLLATMRLYLQVHSLAQVTAGYALGFATIFILLHIIPF